MQNIRPIGADFGSIFVLGLFNERMRAKACQQAPYTVSTHIQQPFYH